MTQYRRFVANSTAGIEFLANVMRVKREYLSFVPNGVEIPTIVPGTDWRAKLGLKPEQLLVVKVANVTNFKDHATLLRAWKIVQDEWQDGERPVLALAGYLTGDIYPECERITREAGMESTVRFLGGITDVPALLNACDMTAFSSRNEGMPNGVLECMAAGKAVVASDLPGIRDALGPGAEGSRAAGRCRSVRAYAARYVAQPRKTRCAGRGQCGADSDGILRSADGRAASPDHQGKPAKPDAGLVAVAAAVAGARPRLTRRTCVHAI